MGDQELQVRQNEGKKSDIIFIQDKFGISESVNHLHKMMVEVTKDEFNAKNVNAACHCIHQLNEVINTTIKAAKFLRDNGDA